ncbi:MAG: cation:proton antiporter [Bacteroidetes bacterium]|nr:cation:proton antiporter [Bacteroidota bacterium]MBK9524926.1 cation:proton antiporter [Bacteroidota bacterium]MBK9543096.1 cation:proton antiporter [Bacteroidota bacterium]
MAELSHHEVVVLFLSIGIMLLMSRFLAELGRRIGLPIVMGEMIVGILLGPTVFGAISPDWYEGLFPGSGPVAISIQAIVKLSVVMLLFVAGMEVQLPVMLKQGRLALSTSLTSMVVPFSLGFWISWQWPELFLRATNVPPLVFSLFFGTALAITALPVIARILMDLNIYKTKIGMLIMAAAMFNDLLGWLIFSVVLAMVENRGVGTDIGLTILYILLFGILMLTLGRKILNRVLPFIQTKFSWPGGVLSMGLGLCFLAAAFTEGIGIHAILGAFIMGIAMGDSVHLHERAREIIHQFVTNIFAPLFMVSIGLHVNFIEHFNLVLILLVLGLAFVGKIVGAGAGAIAGGLNFRDSAAVAMGMNARGAMEIILGTLAFRAGIIQVELFVALVVMALVTSLASGPAIRRILSH